MKIFSKKDKGDSAPEKNENFFTLMEESPDKEKSKYKTAPQHVLTPDEVIAGFEDKKPTSVKRTGALESLKKRLTATAEHNDFDSADDNSDKNVNSAAFTDIMPNPVRQIKSEPEVITSSAPVKESEPKPVLEQPHETKKDLITEPQKEVIKVSESATAPKVVTAPTVEVIKTPEVAVTEIPKVDIIKEDISAETEPNEEPKVVYKPTLLDKCNAYIKDDEGKRADLDTEPPYKLQSVAEILQSNSDETLKMLSDKYNISFDDLGRAPKKPVPQTQEVEIPINEPASAPAKEPVSEPVIKNETPAEDSKQIFEEKISFKNVQSNVKSVISDIDAPYLNTSGNIPKNIHDTATITFTPVGGKIKGAPRINVSSKTRPIDLTGEIAELPEVDPEPKTVQLEKNEFEEYVPEEEFDTQKNAGKIIRKYSILKRNRFLTTTVSIFLTVILSITELPFMSQIMYSHTKTTMIIFSAITALITIANLNMFASLKNILNRRGSADICASLATLSTLAYAVVGIMRGVVFNDMLLHLAFILSFRSLMVYYKTSYMLSNMKFIRGNYQKTAVKLIDDNAVTFAMSKNSIEGDVLIAAPQKTTNISDFMKYSTFGTFLSGMLPILTVISVLLSVILGFTCSYYFDNLVYGLYAAAAIQCFTALPTVFFIDILPVYRANKKLKLRGGMIFSKTAADHLEESNAIVVEAADLFPAGRITLHQMKVLSENNLEDTLIRAASLTKNLGSSLAPIFKEIAGTGNITVLPDSDTVKYEDRMGISGWVDNRLLFIGNRTLMEAHGIEVPSVEVDRKILREGYFPVYVATREKACALLIIQYHVDRDIARELRELTASGVTLLVNSCDPNLIEEMICDYFGLYSDSVKVMSAAGSHMYKNAVSPAKNISAPAVYRSNPLALASILNRASKIRKSNTLLTVMYILSAVLGAVIFAYASLGGSGNLIHQSVLLLYGGISTAVSYLFYFFARP